MKKILLLLLALTLSSFTFSQFCGTATNKGVITPNLTTQTTPLTGNGERPYWSFTGVAGCTYTFTTCGLTTMDTELEILQGIGGTPLLYNDDACGLQSRLIWLCPTNGTYTIFITRYGFPFSCRTLNSNVTMQYFNNCGGLPIELIDFTGYNNDGVNKLTWSTASENNNNYFLLENSTDGYIWSEVGTIDGAGNSTSTIVYDFNHENYRDTINYYRLTQVDYDGKYEVFKIISINNLTEGKQLKMIVNLLGQEVSNHEKGILIEIYTDGTTKKVFKE